MLPEVTHFPPDDEVLQTTGLLPALSKGTVPVSDTTGSLASLQLLSGPPLCPGLPLRPAEQPAPSGRASFFLLCPELGQGPHRGSHAVVLWFFPAERATETAGKRGALGACPLRPAQAGSAGWGSSAQSGAALPLGGGDHCFSTRLVFTVRRSGKPQNLPKPQIPDNTLGICNKVLPPRGDTAAPTVPGGAAPGVSFHVSTAPALQMRVFCSGKHRHLTQQEHPEKERGGSSKGCPAAHRPAQRLLLWQLARSGSRLPLP